MVRDGCRAPIAVTSPSKLLMPPSPLPRFWGGCATLLTTTNISSAPRWRQLINRRFSPDRLCAGRRADGHRRHSLIWYSSGANSCQPVVRKNTRPWRDACAPSWPSCTRFRSACLKCVSSPIRRLAAQTIAQSGIGAKYGLSVIAICRNTHVTLAPQPSEVVARE